MATTAPERPTSAIDVDAEVLDPFTDEQPPVNSPVALTYLSAATLLTTLAAAWMLSAVFSGPTPRLEAAAAAVLGVGGVAASFRLRRAVVLQWLLLPAVLAFGAVAAILSVNGTANLPSLVLEALRAGGLGHPPIAYDPGWRFLLVVLVALLGAAALALSIALDRPTIGLFGPAAVALVAVMIQPPHGELLNVGVALVLAVLAMAVSFGAELTRQGSASTAFELRRLARAGVLVLVLAGILAGLTQVRFLFPDTTKNQVIPPQKPKAPPSQPDRALFDVTSPLPVPWRLGVLDGYADNGWLTSPFDDSTLRTVKPGLAVPDREPLAPDAKTMQVTFEMHDLGGHVLPDVAAPQQFADISGARLRYDPRTQQLRTDQRVGNGIRYTVSAPMPPTGKQLEQAPDPPRSMAPFLKAPLPAPSAVQALLNKAPANLWDRLDYVRNEFYKKVVAAGPGNPVDVSPARVVEVMQGKDASPFEITASEALLARWAGVPSRIGYGYFGGVAKGPRTVEVRPRYGATWLEVYFEGHGWMPLVGIPPHARASLDHNQKNPDPNVKPSDKLSLTVYVPVEESTLQQLYDIARYYAARVVGLAAGGVLLWFAIPIPVKAWRRSRRRAWAAAGGPAHRVIVAYTDLRDDLFDLNVGEPSATPLEFLRYVDYDAEHVELAWLVTRSMWGDLVRDLQPADAAYAEEFARSVGRRVRRAQSPLARLSGATSRASLREPFSRTIPNPWPDWRLPSVGDLFAGLRRVTRGGWRRLATRTASTTSAVVVLVLVAIGVGSCGGGGHAVARVLPADYHLPARIVPTTLGDLTFHREVQAEVAYEKAGSRALVERGQVYTFRRGSDVDGAVEIAAFKPGVTAREKGVLSGVLKTIEGGGFILTRIADQRIYVLSLPAQTIYVWVPPSGYYLETLVARRGYGDGDRVFVQLLNFQAGRDPNAGTTVPLVLDPRRGADEPVVLPDTSGAGDVTVTPPPVVATPSPAPTVKTGGG